MVYLVTCYICSSKKAQMNTIKKLSTSYAIVTMLMKIGHNNNGLPSSLLGRSVD